MRDAKPYHIRKIDDNIVLTEELCARDYADGARYMEKQVKQLNEFFPPYYDHELSWTSEIKNQREVHYFLTIRESGV